MVSTLLNSKNTVVGSAMKVMQGYSRKRVMMYKNTDSGADRGHSGLLSVLLLLVVNVLVLTMV